jgi:hypothetical protein
MRQSILVVVLLNVIAEANHGLCVVGVLWAIWIVDDATCIGMQEGAQSSVGIEIEARALSAQSKVAKSTAYGTGLNVSSDDD